MSNKRQISKALRPLLLTSLLIISTESMSQKRPDNSGASSVPRTDTMLSRDADIQNRELRLLLLTEPEKSNTPSADDRKLIVSQIFEDFQRIQTINREMTEVSSNSDRAAYKRLSSLADDMNKRAKRLRINLGIPDLTEQQKKDHADEPTLDASQLKTSVQALSVSVKSFVTNPLFQEPRATDVHQLINLRRDIFNIIDVSHMVKKAAGNLR